MKSLRRRSSSTRRLLVSSARSGHPDRPDTRESPTPIRSRTTSIRSPRSIANGITAREQGDLRWRRKFLKPEVMIPVKCNIHSWMHAYIGVVDNPYFAVTGADGTFEIANLPPGDLHHRSLAGNARNAGTKITVAPSGENRSRLYVQRRRPVIRCATSVCILSLLCMRFPRGLLRNPPPGDRTGATTALAELTALRASTSPTRCLAI